MDQARRLKELERENGRLKKLLAETMLDNAILGCAGRSGVAAQGISAEEPSHLRVLAPHFGDSTGGGPNAFRRGSPTVTGGELGEGEFRPSGVRA